MKVVIRKCKYCGEKLTSYKGIHAPKEMVCASCQDDMADDAVIENEGVPE